MKEYRFDKKANAYIPVEDERHVPNERLLSILLWAMMFLDWSIVPIILSFIAYSYYSDRSPYLSAVARETINFQISLFIYFVFGSIVAFLLTITIIGAVLTIPIYLALAAYQIVIPILGILKALNHEVYQPHFAIQFL